MGRRSPFADDPRPLLLRCGVQHYDWGQRGARAFIPSLLGQEPDEATPYAELWIGAHPVKPALAEIAGEARPLPELIEADPDAALGEACRRELGPRLPFLLKVLAAERMLSIQAHPDRAQAREGFAREEAAGIPRGADHRNYRDDNHKPELIVALTEFHALSGFQSAQDLAATAARHPELAAVTGPAPDARTAFVACMTLASGALDDAVRRLVARLAAEDAGRPFGPDRHEHWVLRADRQFSRAGRRDPGVLAMLLLNLVRLEPGQGLFLDAGELHSYLEGVGVELMANSDNVLRGGLTSKHVDVAELRRILTFRSAPPRVLVANAAGLYDTPAPEFRLFALAPAATTPWAAPPDHGPDVLLVTEGAASLRWARGALELQRGDAVFVPSAVGAYDLAGRPAARVFRATTP